MELNTKKINEDLNKALKEARKKPRKNKPNYKAIQDEILGPKKYRCKTNKDWKKRWKAVVKEDYDWDGSHLFALILIKLHYIYEYMNRGSICVPEEYDRMKPALTSAIALGNKIWENNYEEEAMEFGKAHCQHKEEQRENGIVCWGEWDSEENQQIWHNMLNDAWKAKEADELEFFTIIAKHYNEWWD